MARFDPNRIAKQLDQLAFHKGLKLKFASIVAVLFILWVSVGSVLNYGRYVDMTVGNSEHDAKALSHVLATAVSQYMMSSDYEGLGTVLESLADKKNILFIKVHDASGSLVKEFGDTTASEGMMSATSDINSQGFTLGTLTVGISTRENVLKMRSFIFSQAVAVILLGIISVFVFIVSFNKFVLTPVGRMNKILASMAAGGGDLTQRLTVTAKDEIGELAENFNVFLENLLGMVKRVKELGMNVYGLTGKIDSSSRSISSGAQDQLSATNQNFRAIESMNHTIQDVAGSADGLSINATDSSATVTEMAAQVDVVAESTQDLSGHVEEASSSISEMANSVREVASNVKGLADVASNVNNAINDIEVSIKEVENRAKESARLSQEVSHDAETLGNEAMARTIEGMERIRETVEGASDVIESLGRRSIEIGQIVKVIDEVTNQTSLLALNAAILAAQAGEHGKGFDVVANEIKDLAERTSSSTGEITRLIKSVQKESQAAVESMREGRERVMEGTQMTYGAADALKKILESSNRSKETAMGIEHATTQQVAAVRQVADAVNNMHERVKSIERATLEQSKGSELIAAAAERISDIAREVRRAMNEQARGIKEFAKSLDDTKDMVSTIADATRTQSDGSGRLVESMETILEIAQSNLDMSNDMERSVQDLTGKAESLRDEMSRFRVSEDEAAL